MLIGAVRALVVSALATVGVGVPMPLADDLDYLSRDAYAALNEQVGQVKRRLQRFMQSLSSAER